MFSTQPLRALAHTPAKPESDATPAPDVNVNNWVFSHAVGQAELPVRHISVQDLNSTNRARASGRLVSFNLTAFELAHVSEPVGAGRQF
jgi:hypothetical protein